MNFLQGNWNKNIYYNIEKIGKGGFGTVYKVLDEGNKERVLKMSKDTSSITREYYTMENLKNLDFIPTVYDFDDFQYKGEIYHFIVMDYIPGENLKEVSKKNKLKIEEVFQIGYFIVDSLEKIYNIGYRYYDIKLENIILTRKNAVYFVDFGGVAEKNSHIVEYTPNYNMISWKKNESGNYFENIIFSTTMVLITMFLRKEYHPFLFTLEDINEKIKNTNLDKEIKKFLQRGLNGKYGSLNEYKSDLKKLSYHFGGFSKKTDKIDYFFVGSIIFFIFSLLMGKKFCLF